MKLSSILGTVAPVLASVIAGPAGGAAVKILSKNLFGKTDTPVDKIITAVASGIQSNNPEVLGRLANAEKEFKETMDKMFENDAKQLEINKIDAQSKNLWQKGWRPATGWTCAGALVWHYLLQPMLNYFLLIFDVTPPQVTFEMNTLVTILFGMLGLGGLRTYEKKQNIAN